MHVHVRRVRTAEQSARGGGSVPGKLQYGSAWWFLDQLDRMTAQIRALSNMGLLSRFVGMVTDSRSFLSYSRHEYFRRLLCNILGNDVKRGLVPDERSVLARLIQDIAFFQRLGLPGRGPRKAREGRRAGHLSASLRALFGEHSGIRPGAAAPLAKHLRVQPQYRQDSSIFLSIGRLLRANHVIQ